MNAILSIIYQFRGFLSTPTLQSETIYFIISMSILSNSGVIFKAYKQEIFMLKIVGISGAGYERNLCRSIGLILAYQLVNVIKYTDVHFFLIFLKFFPVLTNIIVKQWIYYWFIQGHHTYLIYLNFIQIFNQTIKLSVCNLHHARQQLRCFSILFVNSRYTNI